MLISAIGSGIVLGFAFALSAVGFTVIHLGTKTVNFANGQFMVLGGYVVWVLYGQLELPFVVAAVAAAACGAILGILVDRTVIGLLRRATLLTQVVSLVAVASILDGLFLRSFGPDSKNIPAYADTAAWLPGLNWSRTDVWIIGVTAAVIAALLFGLYRTDLGRRLRATADNPTASALLGINPGRVSLGTWAVGGAITSLAGALILPKLLLAPDVGFVMTFAAFAAVVLGGFGSLTGAITGGLLIGVAQSVVGSTLTSGYDAVVSAVVMLVVLSVAPKGLVGERA